jgi:glycosyltransferase involved in cell wall biosynthesis
MSSSMSNPLVSVIMPAFRHERYVGAAIESVLAQTIDDWELIVIDDCSPDGTWEEIGRFEDLRITTIRHEVNCGAHATLNEGLALARGRYAAILNSDDVYRPARLESTLRHLEDTGAALVGTRVRLIDDEGAPIAAPEHPWNDWYDGRLKVLRASGDLVTALLEGNLFVTTSNFVFRRELADRVGGFDDLRYTHDYAFVLAAASQPGSQVAFLPDEVLVDYRWHGSNTIREDWWRVAIEEFSVICRYFPRFFPEASRARLESGLRHLSSLSPICPDADAGELARLQRDVTYHRHEANTWRLHAGHMEGEACALREDVARLGAEVERLENQVTDLLGEVAGLRGSYSFRLGSALLAPLRGLRGLGAGRR